MTYDLQIAGVSALEVAIVVQDLKDDLRKLQEHDRELRAVDVRFIKNELSCWAMQPQPVSRNWRMIIKFE